MIIEWYRELFLFLWGHLGFFGGIVGISVIVSLACFPIYNVIGRIVGMENTLQSALNPAIAKIREIYADAAERQSAIERLYARFGYHPILGVRKVLPLFVSIPFLMLTYYMLAGTTELDGVKWLCFNDLSKSDGMLFGINILPFVMTGINLLTVYATPCFNKKDEAQAWGIAIFFLVILYTANTALMIYWTLNQFFNFLRSLYVDHWGGAKLLANRILSLRHLPQGIWSWFTADRLCWFALAIMLVSVYMWLMVYMQVWFFNCFVSRFLMIPTLLFALAIFSLSRSRRILSVILLSVSFSFGCVIVAGFVAPVVMQCVIRYLNFERTYLALLAVSFLVLAFLSFQRSKGRGGLASAIRTESHWLLLPLILALHYSFSGDLVKLPFLSVLGLIGELLFPAFFIACLLVLMLGARLGGAKVYRLGIFFAVGVYLVPMISLESGKFFSYQNNLVARLVFMTLLAIVMMRFNKRKPSVVFLCMLLGMATVNAVVSNFRVAEENIANSEEESEASRAFRLAKAVRNNSVYLLIYDSYAHDKILVDQGITAARIKDILMVHGFKRYDAYSVGSDTVNSMGNSFAIGGVVQGSLRSMMSGNNPFCDFLKRSGYRTSYIRGAYSMPRQGERMPGDFYFPRPQTISRLENILFSCILRGYLSQEANTFDSFTREEWIDVKRTQIEVASITNSFIYAHAEMPAHLTANAMYRKSAEEEVLDYTRRLTLADAEMEADIKKILSKDDDSIIIVASDHGAFFRLCDRGDYGQLDLLDRCGIQLYVRWPKDYQPTLKLDCLTNVFLETMIYLTGDTSLARFESEGVSLPIQAPLKAPVGTIKRGIIQNGRDKGKNLFK